MVRPICLAFLIAFLNQLSGINAMLYFALRIFEITGLYIYSATTHVRVGIGLTNLVFTFIGFVRLIPHLLDAKPVDHRLLRLHPFTWALFMGFLCVYSPSYPFVFSRFIAALCCGTGWFIRVFISEIFPNRNRAAGQALGSSTHWIFAALLTLFFPVITERMAPGTIFAFFCFMMILQLFYLRFMVHETKGVPLEKMLQELGRAIVEIHALRNVQEFLNLERAKLCGKRAKHG